MENDISFYIVRSPNDLLYLKSLKSIFYRFNAVKIEMDNLDNETSCIWEQKINRYYKACGCGEGKFFVFIFFLIAVGWKYSQNNLFFSWPLILFVFLMCVLGAFIGKAYGKYSAFQKLKKLIQELELSN